LTSVIEHKLIELDQVKLGIKRIAAVAGIIQPFRQTQTLSGFVSGIRGNPIDQAAYNKSV
jgi:hypothetical protein